MATRAVLRHPRRTGLGLGLGGDYNPEQWDEATWREDVALMREAGVTFATVGVFSWARIEPRHGERDFGWLDQVLDLLDEHDIAVDLATATASPPAWLVREHPEIRPVDADGHVLDFGGRQSWCPSSPVFRAAALELVEDLAARYAGHPALTMWHVSNELGCHNALCFCPTSAEAFRSWLQRRYGDLDALNHAWGTAFWSQAYAEWDHVEPPRRVTAIPNPTAVLDFRRFSSDALLDHYRAEREVLRRHSPDVPITTNLMVSRHIDGLDYLRWAPELRDGIDVVSNDHYLDGSLEDAHVELALCADWTRGVAAGEPWVLMEHSTSAVNWQPRNYPKAPGQLVRNTLQHVARGADTAGFFQWRASVSGAEKYHSAMLPHAGTQSRVWREVVRLGEILESLGEVAGSRPVAEVAFLVDHECWWALQGPSLPASGLSYVDVVRELYRATWDLGVTVDVVPPWADLSGYRAVVAPLLHVVSDEDAQRINDYVEGGGHLLTTWFSGIVDPDLRVRPGAYPGAFRELLGVAVSEFSPLRPDQVVDLSPRGSAGEWVEDLALDGAEAVLTYADGPLPGVPALTRRQVGAGSASYLATRTDAATTGDIVRDLLDRAGVSRPESWTPGVELVRRVGDGRSYAFVLNHTDAEVSVPLRGQDLVTGTAFDEGTRVPAGGVACVWEADDQLAGEGI